MKIKEKKWFFSLLGFLIVVLYVLFSSQPLKKELQLLPEWTVNLEDSYLAHRDADSHFVRKETEELLPFCKGAILVHSIQVVKLPSLNNMHNERAFQKILDSV